MEKGYKKLIAWQKADTLAYEIYLATKTFPKDELYGLVSQIRRAALSIPTNLAEGCGRQNRKEVKYFANIALGSLAEVEYLIDFSLKLALLSKGDHLKLQSIRQEVGNLLWKLFCSF